MKGKAEAIRWLLAYAGQEFEDDRITKENWPKIEPGKFYIGKFLTLPPSKLYVYLFNHGSPEMLTGQVPQIEYDGVPMAQSMAIVRFLAKEFGLAGKTNIESYKADMVGECIMDLFGHGIKMRNESDETKKAELMAKFKDEVVPNFWKNVTRSIEESGGQFVAAKEVTYGDIVLAVTVDLMTSHMQLPVESIPKPVRDIKAAIEANEGVKKYLESRPVTEF